MNVTLDAARLRGAMVSADFSMSRGGGVGSPRKQFGQTPSDKGAYDFAWRRAINDTHQRLMSANGPQLADLLDLYVVLVAKKVRAGGPAAPFVPGGTVLSAAISAVSSLSGFGHDGSSY